MQFSRFVLSAALVFLPLISNAQLGSQPAAPKAQTYKIAGISVEGNVFAEPQNIINNSGLAIGDEITLPSEKISGAITRLWNQRLYADIQILEDQLIGDQLFLVIKIKEHNRLDTWEWKGLDELDKDDLEKVVTLIKGQILTPANLKRWEKSIIKRYEKDGYLRSSVIFEQVEKAPGKVNLVIAVDEGPDVFIKKIRFDGNKAFEADELISAFKETRQDSWWRIFGGPKFKREDYEKDKALLKDFYQEKGFKDFRLIGDSISFNPENDRQMFIDIKIFEGEKYFVRNIDWVGNKLYSDTLLFDVLGFKTGDVYDQKKLSQNLYFTQEGKDIGSLYYDRGYMFFQVDKQETVVGKDSVDLTFTLTEGTQVNIGRVHIRGNTKTKEKVLRRELYTLPGYTFSRDAIVRSQRQISVLNFFDPEKIDIQTPIIDQETVDIVYTVQEKSSDQFNMSAGYSATYGFSGAVGLTFTNFSAQEFFNKEAWQPIPVGDAQRLSIDAQFGVNNRYNTYSFSYQEPWFNDTPTSVGFSLFYTYQNIYYQLIQKGLSISVGRRLKWPDDYFSGNWILRFQSNDYQSDVGSYYYQPGKSTQITLTQVLSRNSFDNPIYPRSGSNLVLYTELAGAPFLPGTSTYTKHKLTLEGYSRIAGDLVLFQSSRFGFLHTRKPNDKTSIPFQEYFYMGGSGLSAFETISLRGYDDREVGPRDLTDTPIGAKTFFKYSTELRYPLTLTPQASVYMIGFFDAGNAWRQFDDASLFELKRSVGAGVRIFLPFVGMIGLDYGYGLDGTGTARNPNGWTLTFTFGQGQ